MIHNSYCSQKIFHLISTRSKVSTACESSSSDRYCQVICVYVSASNSISSLNYTAAKQHNKWCKFHHVKTNDTSKHMIHECLQKGLKGKSNLNSANNDSYSRSNHFENDKNTNHNTSASSANNYNSSSNIASLFYIQFQVLHQMVRWMIRITFIINKIKLFNYYFWYN